MKRGFKALAVLAAVVAAIAGPQAFAFCDSTKETPAIFQCAERAWFEAPPAGSGAVSGVFWGIGFGNNTVNNGLDTRGVGMSSKIVMNGNDSGLFAVDFLDAASLLGAPTGSICLGSNNWANAGVDGCADNPRDVTQLYADDNILNPEYDVYYARTGYPGTPSTAWIQDAPMGILVTEGNGHHFAVAAVASMARSGVNDVSPGFFNFADVSNGTANPILGTNSNVPWQRVPGDVDPLDSSTYFVRTILPDLVSNWVVDLGWNGAVVQSDASVKPSTNAVVTAIGLPGMGVADHGSLVRYVVEVQGIDPNVAGFDPDDPAATLNPNGWTVGTLNSGPAEGPPGDFTAQITVSPNTCIRLVTLFGMAPATSVHKAATCRQGICGDLGYDLESPPACIGGAGPLAADGTPRNVKAVRGKGAVNLSFDTASELTVKSFKVFAMTKKSGLVELVGIPCQECVTGSGGKYKVRIPNAKLKGARELEIRAVGPGSATRVNVK
jgi:hypothetical protein